jgi:hypothetical protein
MNVNKKLRLAVKYQTGNLQQAENLYKEILENRILFLEFLMSLILKLMELQFLLRKT